MPRAASALSNLKETLLILTVFYFYGLAFALLLHRETFGLDQPAIFLAMCGIFLLSVAFEVVLAWWNTKRFLLWIGLGVVSYGVIGLYLAPILYGQGILVYVLLEPLVIVFIGGLAFSYGHIFALQIMESKRVSPAQLSSAVLRLPGWAIRHGGIEKTYLFQDFPEALNFVNRVATIAARTHHKPAVFISGASVVVRLTTPEEGGVTVTDLNLARSFDALV
ncbi:MAG: 4a-hydroxytetrahydrobiopterin dehydratase [Patescibacteria group bacterium]